MTDDQEPPRPEPDFRIYVQRQDNAVCTCTRRIDVTHAVMDCFDVAVNSLDFGSGFLSSEEVHNLHALAVAIGADVSVFDRYGMGHR